MLLPVLRNNDTMILCYSLQVSMCINAFRVAQYIAGTHVRYYHDIRVSDNAKLIPEIFSYEIADNAV